MNPTFATMNAPAAAVETRPSAPPTEPPYMSRGDAQRLLKGRGMQDGDYEIRQSNNTAGCGAQPAEHASGAPPHVHAHRLAPPCQRNQTAASARSMPRTDVSDRRCTSVHTAARVRRYVLTCCYRGAFYNEVIHRDGAVLMYHEFALGTTISEALESLQTTTKLEPSDSPTKFHIVRTGSPFEQPVEAAAAPPSAASPGSTGTLLPGQLFGSDEEAFEEERRRKARERAAARQSSASASDAICPPLEPEAAAADGATEVVVSMCPIDGWSSADLGTEVRRWRTRIAVDRE